MTTEKIFDFSNSEYFSRNCVFDHILLCAVRVYYAHKFQNT
ncbi:hypothetical protein HMPREF1992_01140 [Selenomonas sp. oral taxon 892 str. F0426]|nr:hypothetical protein HMPREF1992_01140 [Selenomonas sp. oral taxon 892 str. F0426]